MVTMTVQDFLTKHKITITRAEGRVILTRAGERATFYWNKEGEINPVEVMQVLASNSGTMADVINIDAYEQERGLEITPTEEEDSQGYYKALRDQFEGDTTTHLDFMRVLGDELWDEYTTEVENAYDKINIPCPDCGLHDGRHNGDCYHGDCDEDDQAVHGCGPRKEAENED